MERKSAVLDGKCKGLAGLRAETQKNGHGLKRKAKEKISPEKSGTEQQKQKLKMKGIKK